MTPAFKQCFWFLLAALAEIGGCYAFWLVLKLKRGWSPLLYGIPLLLLFAWALTRIETTHASRAYAAYATIYLVASLGWMRMVEKETPSLWDWLGASLCVVGMMVILVGNAKGGS